MTYEFKKIIETYALVSKLNVRAVLATVVCVEGSSYRREGVRMLILDNGQTVGAISGGCVEKEVVKQSESVFKDRKAKMMTYDGRYRLGCEGVLYVLLELFEPASETLQILQDCFLLRKPFIINSDYYKDLDSKKIMRSFIETSNRKEYFFSKRNNIVEESGLLRFKEQMRPCFRLIIVGAEHDAEILCQMASLIGWEVTLVCSPQSLKTKLNFTGASEIVFTAPDNWNVQNIDNETVVLLMTHNFAKDVLYLKTLKATKPIYIGLLGPAKRREKLLDAFIEYYPEVEKTFLNVIHGPAGLNIGAETPEEIAISIIAEITSVVRNQKAIPLQDKKGGIHDYALNKRSKPVYES